MSDELRTTLTALERVDELRRKESLLFIAQMVERVKVCEYEAADLRRRAALLSLGFDPMKDYSR